MNQQPLLPHHPLPKKQFHVSQRIIFLSLTFSIAQLVQEVVSERIFDGKTNETNSMASLAMFYAFTQQICCSLMAFLMLTFVGPKPNSSPPPWKIILFLACLIGLSSSFANWAVEFVFYPAKVVMKSTKLVPTMMVSPFFGNSKAYSISDYISAIFLSIGAAGFALASGRLSSDEDGPDLHLAWIGLTLLTLAALGDALIPNLQQQTMREGCSPEQMALRVNALSAFAILMVLFFNGNILPWIELWQRDSTSLSLMLFGGFTFSIAVLSYTFLIVEAGSVAAVGVATIRKVITLVLSYILFPGKTITIFHFISLGLFSFGLILKPMITTCCSRKKTKHDVL